MAICVRRMPSAIALFCQGVQSFKVGGVALVVDFRPTGFAVFVLDEQPQVGAKVAVAQLCVFGTRLVRVCEENAQRLARCGWVDVPILNAGDGTHQHPTQALLDAFTLRRHLHRGADLAAPEGSGLDGAHVAIVGDVLHSRVARSNVGLLALLGARVTLVAPPTLLPVGMEAWPCDVSYTLDDVLARRPDAVMMLRVQRERMSSAGGGFFPSPEEYSRQFGLNAERLAALGRGAILMHPGPMNRGLEVCADAADSAHSVVTEQVANGVSVRMAALYLLLAHGQEI